MATSEFSARANSSRKLSRFLHFGGGVGWVRTKGSVCLTYISPRCFVALSRNGCVVCSNFWIRPSGRCSLVCAALLSALSQGKALELIFYSYERGHSHVSYLQIRLRIDVARRAFKGAFVARAPFFLFYVGYG